MTDGADQHRGRARFGAFARAAIYRAFARAKQVLTTEPGETPAAPDAAAAAELARSASRLGGGMAKVAQLMAYVDAPLEEGVPGAGSIASTGTPLESRSALAALWDQAPGHDPAAIRAVVEQELGAPIDRVFASWDDTPLAAASLGEVHAATALKDGAPLAVKVQYPGVAEALRADVQSGTLLAKLAGAGVGRGLSAEAAAVLREALLAELDYVAEARAQERFRLAFARDPAAASIVIARVYPAQSTGRVLTMDRLFGTPLGKFAAAAPPEARAAVAETIFRFAYGGPLRHGLLDADPNPGNYLVLDDGGAAGRVGFVDFGCAPELESVVVEADQRLWRAMLSRDGETFRFAVHDSGLVPRNRAGVLDSDTYRAWERFLAGPFVDPAGYEWTPLYAFGLAERTRELVLAGGMTLGPDVLLLWRQRLGVAAVLGMLRPHCTWRAILESILRA